MRTVDAHDVSVAALSAIGSLPQHLMALTVAFAISGGLAGAGQAGLVSSCFVVGMLISTVGLPLLGVRRVTRPAAVGLLLAVAGAGLVASAGSWLGPAALAAWVVMGMACGGLNVLGSLFAAAAADGKRFLQLRLGAVLLGASVVLGAAHALGVFRSYGQVVMVIVVVAVLGLAIVRLYPPPPVLPRAPTKSGLEGGRRAAIAFAVLALFFIGQPGFTAFAAHIAAGHGVQVSHLPLIYAVGKGVAAVMLLAAARHSRTIQPSLALSVVLSLAVLGMGTASDSVLFLAALLAWELAVNLQSTRYQALVLARHPRLGGPWLMASISCGAALGPMVHGALLEAGLGAWFLVASMATAFIPVLATARSGDRHG